jgi:hypothetical protein
MKTIYGRFTAMLLCAALVCLCAASAMARPMGATATAGFSGLPLRNCQGTYCAEVKKLHWGQELRIIYDDYTYGWAQVEVVGTGEKGWVCDANIF